MVDERRSQAERIVKKKYILYRFIILAVKKSFNLLRVRRSNFMRSKFIFS